MIREKLAGQFDNAPDAVLSGLLLLAALAIAGIAIFSDSRMLKIIALLYILLP